MQAREDVRDVLLWLDTVTRLGPQASGIVNLAETARWLATTLGVPTWTGMPGLRNLPLSLPSPGR